MRSTSELLERTRQASPHLGDPLHYASAAVFVMLNSDGHVDTAHHLLVGAIEGGAHRYDSADTALIDALATLALVCFSADAMSCGIRSTPRWPGFPPEGPRCSR